MIKHMDLSSNGNVARARDAAAAEFGSTTFGDVIEGPGIGPVSWEKVGRFPGDLLGKMDKTTLGPQNHEK